MGTPFNYVSAEAQRSLEEFSEAFALALTQGGVDQWAKELGLNVTSKAIKTTYPVPVSAAGYNEFKDDIKYRSLFQKSLEIIPRDWQDGIKELARIIDAPDFIGWTSEPAAIAQAAMSLANEWVTTELEANANGWDEVPFFDNSHPINVFDVPVGTFDNLHAATEAQINDGTWIAAAKQNLRDIPAPNGKRMGLQMTHVLIPSNREQQFKDLLEQDMLIQAVQNVGETENVAAVTQANRHKGTVAVSVSDELTEANSIYTLALNKPGMVPWIVQDGGAPLEIRHDKDSHLFKTELKVGIAFILEGYAATALPHCIQKYLIT